MNKRMDLVFRILKDCTYKRETFEELKKTQSFADEDFLCWVLGNEAGCVKGYQIAIELLIKEFKIDFDGKISEINLDL